MRDILTCLFTSDKRALGLSNQPTLNDIEIAYRPFSEELHPNRLGNNNNPIYQRYRALHNVISSAYHRLKSQSSMTEIDLHLVQGAEIILGLEDTHNYQDIYNRYQEFESYLLPENLPEEVKNNIALKKICADQISLIKDAKDTLLISLLFINSSATTLIQLLKQAFIETDAKKIMFICNQPGTLLFIDGILQDGYSCLHYACLTGHIEIFKHIFNLYLAFSSQGKINLSDILSNKCKRIENGKECLRTPFDLAIESKKVEIVGNIIQIMYQIDLKSGDGCVDYYDNSGNINTKNLAELLNLTIDLSSSQDAEKYKLGDSVSLLHAIVHYENRVFDKLKYSCRLILNPHAASRPLRLNEPKSLLEFIKYMVAYIPNPAITHLLAKLSFEDGEPLGDVITLLNDDFMLKYFIVQLGIKKALTFALINRNYPLLTRISLLASQIGCSKVAWPENETTYENNDANNHITSDVSDSESNSSDDHPHEQRNIFNAFFGSKINEYYWNTPIGAFIRAAFTRSETTAALQILIDWGYKPNFRLLQYIYNEGYEKEKTLMGVLDHRLFSTVILNLDEQSNFFDGIFNCLYKLLENDEIDEDYHSYIDIFKIFLDRYIDLYTLCCAKNCLHRFASYSWDDIFKDKFRLARFKEDEYSRVQLVIYSLLTVVREYIKNKCPSNVVVSDALKNMLLKKDWKGITPLEFAVANQNFEFLTVFIDYIDPGLQINGLTLLSLIHKEFPQLKSPVGLQSDVEIDNARLLFSASMFFSCYSQMLEQKFLSSQLLLSNPVEEPKKTDQQRKRTLENNLIDNEGTRSLFMLFRPAPPTPTSQIENSQAATLESAVTLKPPAPEFPKG